MLKYTESTIGFLMCLALSFSVSSVQSAAFRNKETENIGALVQVHSLGDRDCESVDLHGILAVEAILYAIDEINSGKYLDLEATIGYEIHQTCPDIYEAAKDLVLQARSVKQNTSFVAVLNSLLYDDVDSLLLLLTKKVPIVGCGSFSSRRHANKVLDQTLTKFMFHAVPSDKTLIKAMVDLLTRFDWGYAAAIYDNRAITSSDLDFLEEEATTRNGCIAKTYAVHVNKDNWQISKVIEEILDYGVSAVLLFTTRDISVRLIVEAAKQKATSITWIMAKDSWDRTSFPNIDGDIAQRVVVLDSSANSLSGFKEHLVNLQKKPVKNKWLRKLVADDYSEGSTPGRPDLGGSQGLCNDPVDALCKVNRTMLNHVVEELISVAEDATCVIDAVFAVAHALAAREKCTGPCSTRDPLYKLLREVDFSSPTGRRVSFFTDGYLREVRYSIYSYWAAGSATPSTRHDKEAIGTWKVSTQDRTPELKILPGSRDMNTGLHRVNISYCTEQCHYGQCKVYKKDALRERCCWQCRECLSAAAQLASKNNQTPACPTGACPKEVSADYLHWSETGVLVLLFLVAFGVCFGMYVSFVLLRNRNTPVMHRAKNATVTLLPFILLIFVLPFPLLCKPTEYSCETYRALFLFSLGIPLAALIAKAQVIQEAFYDCDGNAKGNWKCCSPRTTVLLLVLILHVILIVAIRMSEPARGLLLPAKDAGSVFLECSIHSSVSFPILVFYLMIGAGLVSIMSLREVSVPGNDFEVKWVSLSMFFWYILSFLYIALMFSFQGKLKILALGFVDFLHALNLFSCLYIPKWFVVVFRPERNCGDVSPWDVYLKAQEKVSLRLSSQGDTSPVLSKRGCLEVVANNDVKGEFPVVKDTYV